MFIVSSKSRYLEVKSENFASIRIEVFIELKTLRIVKRCWIIRDLKGRKRRCTVPLET